MRGSIRYRFLRDMLFPWLLLCGCRLFCAVIIVFMSCPNLDHVHQVSVTALYDTLPIPQASGVPKCCCENVFGLLAFVLLIGNVQH